MARGLQNYPNVTSADSDYPSKRSKDNTGTNNGTPMNEFTLGDYQQFFAKLLRVVGDTPNTLPDNEYNGLQYYNALTRINYKSYVALLTQSGTAAPTAVVMPNNSIGTIVWTRLGAGAYAGTLTGAFTSNKTVVTMPSYMNDGLNSSFAKIERSSANLIIVRTYDDTFAPTDALLVDAPIEVKVYW